MKTTKLQNKDFINVTNKIDNQNIIDEQNRKIERSENIVIAIGIVAIVALFLFGAV